MFTSEGWTWMKGSGNSDPNRVLDRSFYLSQDVVAIAERLLGKVIITEIKGERTSGMITETEAYAGVTDRASHAFGGRLTERTSTMYAEGGIGYVYLCYGIHRLFNVVTNVKGVPHAVLIRGVEPLEGITTMRERRAPFRFTTNGPGTLTQALGIGMHHNGTDLIHGSIRIEDHGILVPEGSIRTGPRIGVDYAGADARLPYRHWIASSRAIIPNSFKSSDL